MPIYSYSLSPKAFASVKAVNGHNVVDVGKCAVDSVDTLLLAAETVATGNYKWHRECNEIGRALSGSNVQNGGGPVQFGKQPDGTWVLTRH